MRYIYLILPTKEVRMRETLDGRMGAEWMGLPGNRKGHMYIHGDFSDLLKDFSVCLWREVSVWVKGRLVSNDDSN